MDDIVWNIVGWVGVCGLLVALFNIRHAILLGMGVGWLSLCTILILSIASLRETTPWAFISELFTVLGNIIFLLALIGFYTYYCVYENKTYIADGDMPDTWYLFSYFVAVTFALNLLAIITYIKDNNASSYKAVSLLLSTLTMGFVLIETIICTYYRTDGFLV